MQKNHLFKISVISAVIFLIGGYPVNADIDFKTLQGEPTCVHSGSGWQPMSVDVQGGAKSGKFYLGSDVSLTSRLQVHENYSLSICLNGHKIDMGGHEDNIFYVFPGGTLNIYDCKNNTGQERWYYYDPEKEYILLSDEKPEDFAMLEGIKGSFKGGVITGTYRKPAILNQGKLNFYGGTISGNMNTANGGGIASSGTRGAVTIDGGNIIGNTAGDNGGGIHINILNNMEQAKHKISNSVISHNLSGMNGGGIAIQDQGGKVIDILLKENMVYGNQAAENGGGIYINNKVGSGTYTVDGGSITENMAGKDGDGIYSIETPNVEGNPVIQPSKPPEDDGDGSEDKGNPPSGSNNDDNDDDNDGNVSNPDNEEKSGGNSKDDSDSEAKEDDPTNQKDIVQQPIPQNNYAAVRPNSYAKGEKEVQQLTLADNLIYNNLRRLLLWSIRWLKQ